MMQLALASSGSDVAFPVVVVVEFKFGCINSEVGWSRDDDDNSQIQVSNSRLFLQKKLKS